MVLGQGSSLQVRKLNPLLNSAASGYKFDNMAEEFWLRFFRLKGSGATAPLVLT